MSTLSELVVQKLIAMMAANTVITGIVPSSRIYAAHIGTIQDYVLPAISIFTLPGRGRETDSAFMALFDYQIDIWMEQAGKNYNTWDDIFTVHDEIKNTLHRNGGWDDALGVKIAEITNTGNGPQMEESRGIMHYPSRWFVRATT